MTQKQIKAKANAQKVNNVKENAVMSNKVVIGGKEYEVKSKVGNVPYTDVPDGLMEFHIQTLKYIDQVTAKGRESNKRSLWLQGVIHPYRVPEKAAQFVYVAQDRTLLDGRVVKTAQFVMSEIMAKLDEAYANQKEYWFVKRRFDPTLQCPLYTETVPEMRLNETFIVDAKHYNKFLQLDFATYRFQAKIDAANKIPRSFDEPKAEDPTKPVVDVLTKEVIQPAKKPAPKKKTTKKASK